MNIFILDENPAIAASYHCDQHLHKMILESAQMLSTAARARAFTDIYPYLYKPAHPNHPCTLWVNSSIDNMLWLCQLAIELDSIRETAPHSSMDVVMATRDYIQDEYPIASHLTVKHFVFAGPPTIAINSTLNITEKYQKYYRQKHASWVLDKGRGMSYKNRPIPPFMADLIN